VAGGGTQAPGKLAIHRVVDLDPFVIPIQNIFPGASLDELGPDARILADRHVDFAGGKILLVIQSFVLRVGGKTILIDTCVGEHKSRTLRPEWNMRGSTRYLANLAAAGCTPEDIDIVMCTHLHADHVGWNTRLQSGRWVPTFPKARYLMSHREIDQRTADMAQSPLANHGSFQDSVLPVIDAGLVQAAKPGDHIADAAAIIDLAGHSPGQIGLDLAAGGNSRFVFCGDAIHSPVQVFRPDWSSAFCFDRAHAARTRRALLERAVAEDLTLMPGHLRAVSMRVAAKGDGFVPLIEY
jgi:glyoxylase-like metal-dependent hydrolase (beta-lactamase superfamily II)